MNRGMTIKVLLCQFTHDPSFLARFEREVKVAARMQHARVLPVYECDQPDGMPFFIRLRREYLPHRP